MRAESAPAPGAGLTDILSFDGVLAALVRMRGGDAVLRDAPGRQGWSGIAPASLSYRELDQRIERMAGLLAMAGASPGHTVAIAAPMGPEAVVALLGTLRAHCAPLMLPLDAGEAEWLKAVEARSVAFAIGVGRIGERRPLLALRAIAARSFGVRFVGGFGPEIPEGVAALEPMLAAPIPAVVPGGHRPALLRVAADGSIAAMHETAIFGAALTLARELRPDAKARIVTTLAGCDDAALASGLGLALLTGAELMPLGLFGLDDLRACLEAGRPVHLVVPARIEDALIRSTLLGHPALAAVVVVHRSGDRPAGGGPVRPDLPIVDLTDSGSATLAVTRRA